MSRHLQVVPPSSSSFPRTRGECENGPRPCPWVCCRHHLGSEPRSGGRLHVRALPPDHDTCALDVAARGPHTLESIAKLLGLTRERVRQIEARGLVQLRRGARRAARAAGDGEDAFRPEPRQEGTAL